MRLSLPTFVLCAITCIASVAQQQAVAKQARVFVADSDSWETKGRSASGFGAGGGIFGGGAFSQTGGGARPQTAEVIKTIGQRCPNLIVNNRPEMGDYILRLEHEGGKSLLAHKDKVAVFVRTTGDSIFSGSTLSLGGSVQHACDAIARHWAANADALSTPPAIAQTEPRATASLTVESNVAGADIEVDGALAGSTPSTLALVPGKHTIAIKKRGYAAWSRTLTVSGSDVHLSAELEPVLQP